MPINHQALVLDNKNIRMPILLDDFVNEHSSLTTTRPRVIRYDV